MPFDCHRIQELVVDAVGMCGRCRDCEAQQCDHRRKGRWASDRRVRESTRLVAMAETSLPN